MHFNNITTWEFERYLSKLLEETPMSFSTWQTSCSSSGSTLRRQQMTSQHDCTPSYSHPKRQSIISIKLIIFPSDNHKFHYCCILHFKCCMVPKHNHNFIILRMSLTMILTHTTGRITPKGQIQVISSKNHISPCSFARV